MYIAELKQQIILNKPKSIFEYIDKDFFIELGDPEHDHYLLSGNYYEWYYSLTKTLRPKSILEIGVRFGYSMLSMIKGSSNVELVQGYDIDMYNPGSQHIAVTNIKDRISNDIKFDVSLQDSQQLSKLDKFYDLIHIDGCHDFYPKIHDLELCLDHCKYIFIDDYNFIDACNHAVNTFIMDNRDRIKSHTVIPTYRGAMLIELNDVRRTCRISQGAGDILAFIPYIKELNIQHLYIVINMPNIPDWHPCNHGGATALIPLLESQGLTAQVIDYSEVNNYQYDIDFDAPRNVQWDNTKGDIYTWNSLFYGIYPDMTKPWIDIGHVSKGNYIVISQTARFINQNIDYTILNQYNIQKVFIGTEAEFTFLFHLYPNLKDVEFIKTRSFLEAAKVIKGARFSISNQTSLCVLSEAMGTPRIVNICPVFPSVIPKTPNGRPVVAQDLFIKSVEHFIKLTDNHTYSINKNLC